MSNGPGAQAAGLARCDPGPLAPLLGRPPTEARRASRRARWPQVMVGEERAQEVWLKNRSRLAALNGLDLWPEKHAAPTTTVVNTARCRPRRPG